MDILRHVGRLYFLELRRDKLKDYGERWHKRMLRRRKVVNANDNNNNEDLIEEDSASITSNNLLESTSSTDTNRRCWVCFAAEEDDDAPDDEWLHPCICKKSMKWVHNICLNRWVDEKQNGNAFLPVKCPFCLTPYEFEYPDENFIFKPISLFENTVLFLTNNVPAFLFLRVGTAAFEIQYFGRDLNLVQKFVLWCFSEMILPVPWTLMLLMDLRVWDWELAVIRSTVQEDVIIPRQERVFDRIQGLDLGDFIRVRLLPSLAILSGEALFSDKIEALPLRALAGGVSFALLRALLRIPYRRNQFQMASSRRVKNREIENGGEEASVRGWRLTM